MVFILFDCIGIWLCGIMNKR